MLGGTSGINGMIWNRASQKEYDAWEQVSVSECEPSLHMVKSMRPAWCDGVELGFAAPVLQEVGDRGSSYSATDRSDSKSLATIGRGIRRFSWTFRTHTCEASCV